MLLLEGFRLLDLSRLTPGPNATRLLADMGMEVIKVEEPVPRGGFDRDPLTPVGADPAETLRSSAFNPLGRNKKSIAINLKDARGVEVFHRLARTADVILESYRPGVVKRLGIDYETIAAINPQIVYCSISGYGQDGPYAHMPGHDANFQAVAGVLALGGGDNGEPTGPPCPMADHGAGLHAISAILAALLGRPRLGRGQYIEIAMSDIIFTFMPMAATLYLRDGYVYQRGLHSPLALTVLKCKDGKYLCAQNAETYFWKRFCRAIGRPEFVPQPPLEDEAYPKMVAEIRKVMLTKNRDEWLEILRAADTCVSPLHELSEAFDDPHNRYRKIVWEIDHPVVGKVRQIGFPIRFSETPARFRAFAPELGEHTVKLLQEVGYSRDDIAVLIREGVVKSSQPMHEGEPR